jgi:NAD(P)-dependent dehydrogenase (short-subunit alcohol dehydrogenase family)
MSKIQEASTSILARVPKINYLVYSAGLMTTAGRSETVEGIDKKLAVHYYGRWKFVNELMPALVKAKEDGEDARALFVLSAGHSTAIDLEDLGLKKTYSLGNAAGQASAYNDHMIQVCRQSFSCGLDL